MSRKEEVRNFSKDLVTSLENHARKIYGFKHPYEIKLVQSFAHNRRCSWGGVKMTSSNIVVPSINLCLKQFVIPEVSDFYENFLEYPEMAEDETIGTITPAYWKEALVALISHEFAHTVHMMYEGAPAKTSTYIRKDSELHEMHKVFKRNESKDLNGDPLYDINDKYHNKFWQMIYRDIRTQYMDVLNIETEKNEKIVNYL